MSNKASYIEEIFGQDYAADIIDSKKEKLGLAKFLEEEYDLSEEQADDAVASVTVDLSTKKKAQATRDALVAAANAPEVEEEEEEVVPVKKGTAPKKGTTPKVVAPKKKTGGQSRSEEIDTQIARVEALLRTIVVIRDYSTTTDIPSTARGISKKLDNISELFTGNNATALKDKAELIRGLVDDDSDVGVVKFSRVLLVVAKDLLKLAKELDDKNYFNTLNVRIVGAYPSAGDDKSIVGFAILTAGAFKGGKYLESEGFSPAQIKAAGILFLIPSAIEKSGLKAKSIRKGKVALALQEDVDKCRKKMSESNFGGVSFGVRAGQKLNLTDPEENGGSFHGLMGEPFEIFFNQDTLKQIQEYLNAEREKSIYYTMKASSSRSAKSRALVFDTRLDPEAEKSHKGANSPTVYQAPFVTFIKTDGMKPMRDAAEEANVGQEKVRNAALSALGLNAKAKSLFEAGFVMSSAAQAALAYSLVQNGTFEGTGKNKKLLYVAGSDFQKFLRSEIPGTEFTVEGAIQAGAAEAIQTAEDGFSLRMPTKATRVLSGGLNYGKIDYKTTGSMASKLANKTLETTNSDFNNIKKLKIAAKGAGPKDPKEPTDNIEVANGVTAGQIRELLYAEAQAIIDLKKSTKNKKVAAGK